MTILFVELANMDEMWSLKPMDVVSRMNDIFSNFDAIVDEYDVYKVIDYYYYYYSSFGYSSCVWYFRVPGIQALGNLVVGTRALSGYSSCTWYSSSGYSGPW